MYYRRLGRLTSCYERVFERQCGVTGRRLLTGLMSRAFADPHYQRYRYRPDCRLHRADPRRDRGASALPGHAASSSSSSHSGSDDFQRCGSKSSATAAPNRSAVTVVMVTVAVVTTVASSALTRITSS